MKYAILLEPQPEGGFTVTVPDLPGCISQGETESQCQANIAEAIEGWIETAHANGWPVPVPKARSFEVEVRAS
jgi:antitoxin HicB